MGGLSPSRARTDGGATSCLTPGLRFSRANGQSIPSVDSISMVGAGGKVFSSALRGERVGRGIIRWRNTVVYMMSSERLTHNFLAIL